MTKAFALLDGGIPITVRGEVVGAIGVSGGHYVQDEACATALNLGWWNESNHGMAELTEEE